MLRGSRAYCSVLAKFHVRLGDAECWRIIQNELMMFPELSQEFCAVGELAKTDLWTVCYIDQQ